MLEGNREPFDDMRTTPPTLRAQMLDVLCVGNGDRLLEPSAGLGDILEDVLARTLYLDRALVLEINPTLAQHCVRRFESRDVEVVNADFLGDYFGEFSKIAMNPPFEKREAVAHVEHAMNHLAPGGRLVLVIPENQGEMLVEVLITKGFTWEVHLVKEDSFKGKDSFRQTGVSVVLLQVDREEN